MTKKMIFTAILVTFTLLLQYGCNSPEVAEEPVEQLEVAVAAEPAAVEEAAPAEGVILRVNCGSYSDNRSGYRLDWPQI